MIEPRRPRKGDIAFWRYDQYPYLLAGTITKIDWPLGEPEPIVTIKEYGRRFSAAFTLPPMRGTTLRAQLTKLRDAHREERAFLDRRFKELAVRVLEDTPGVHKQLGQVRVPLEGTTF